MAGLLTTPHEWGLSRIYPALLCSPAIHGRDSECTNVVWFDLGWAYRTAGRCEAAIAALKQALNLTPAFIPSRVNLAICYVELGREDEARGEAAEVLRLNPKFSVEEVWRRENQPFRDPTPILERLYAAARKAGLK